MCSQPGPLLQVPKAWDDSTGSWACPPGSGPTSGAGAGSGSSVVVDPSLGVALGSAQCGEHSGVGHGSGFAPGGVPLQRRQHAATPRLPAHRSPAAAMAHPAAPHWLAAAAGHSLVSLNGLFSSGAGSRAALWANGMRAVDGSGATCVSIQPANGKSTLELLVVSGRATLAHSLACTACMGVCLRYGLVFAWKCHPSTDRIFPAPPCSRTPSFLACSSWLAQRLQPPFAFTAARRSPLSARWGVHGRVVGWGMRAGAGRVQRQPVSQHGPSLCHEQPDPDSKPRFRPLAGHHPRQQCFSHSLRRLWRRHHH